MKSIILQAIMCLSVAIFLLSFIVCIVMGLQMIVLKLDNMSYIVLFTAFGMLALVMGLTCYYIYDNEKDKKWISLYV